MTTATRAQDTKPVAGHRANLADVAEAMADLERRAAKARRRGYRHEAADLEQQARRLWPAYQAEMAKRREGKSTITLAELYADEPSRS